MASRGIAVLTREVVAPYAAALEPLGYEVVAMPVTRSEPVDPTVLARAIAEHHDDVVVASARAATALVGAGRPRGRIWAIGPATADILVAAGLAPSLPTDATSAGLARAVIAGGAMGGRRILVPRAEAGRDEGQALLRAAGAIVDEVIAYRTVAVAASDPAIARGLAVLAAAQAALCVVFAPSQVAALIAFVPSVARSVPFAAIGRTTADALTDAGVTAIRVARSPTPVGLVQALQAI